jgi:hypothetical protein
MNSIEKGIKTMAFCEKTGLEFEATSKRVRNHPTIMAMLSDAYRDGWHFDAMEAIKSGRNAGYTTIEQFVSALNDAKEQYKLRTNAIYAAEMQRKREAEEVRRQRHVTNSLLRSRGYEWQRGYSDSDIENDIWNGEGEATGAWELVSPDHRDVSVKEAMFELAFYEDAKFAHDWLAYRGIPEIAPAIELKRREEALKLEAAATQAQVVTYTDEQIAYQQEAIPAFIEAGHSPELAEKEAKRLSLPHDPWQDFVPLSEPEVLPDGRHATLVISGDLRYGALVSDEWYGIDELLEEFPDFPLRKRLAIYRERNRRSQ